MIGVLTAESFEKFQIIHNIYDNTALSIKKEKVTLKLKILIDTYFVIRINIKIL